MKDFFDKILRRELENPKNRQQLRIIRNRRSSKKAGDRIVDLAETPDHALIGKKIKRYKVREKDELIKGILRK